MMGIVNPGFLVLRGRSFPLVAVVLLSIIVAYQLVSGVLIGSRWQVWIIREERPRVYWSIMTAEFLLLCGLWCSAVL